MGEMAVPPPRPLRRPDCARHPELPHQRTPFPRSFLRALALIKSAAAHVNRAPAIEAAADAIAAGQYHDHFPLDIYQTGSGTSTNMNANEVIGRLAGAHPNDEVNRGQSSNDVIPSAMHIAAAERVHHALFPAMERLQHSLEHKSAEFHDVLKIGRTHLQDAVPMRMGQEFGGYARQVRAARERIQAAMPGIYELPLGGHRGRHRPQRPTGFACAAIAELARAAPAFLRRSTRPFRSSGRATRLLPQRRTPAATRSPPHQNRQRHPLARFACAAASAELKPLPVTRVQHHARR